MALGYTLVYGIVELINFAHGDLFMLGSFLPRRSSATLGLTIGAGRRRCCSSGSCVMLVVAMVGCGVLNVLIERVAYRPLRPAPKLAPLITAIGFSFILQNLGLFWSGGSPQGVSRPRSTPSTRCSRLRRHAREHATCSSSASRCR